ncbi:MAG: hypothetical protein U5K43_10165 [Halofilum sp. (in: g-proteobacteria)]|nr:hypothetical protein [Halofilum sp. (in: g-proteobacteria)]
MRTEERSGRGLAAVAILIALAAVVPHACCAASSRSPGRSCSGPCSAPAAIAAILHVLRGWRG